MLSSGSVSPEANRKFFATKSASVTGGQPAGVAWRSNRTRTGAIMCPSPGLPRRSRRETCGLGVESAQCLENGLHRLHEEIAGDRFGIVGGLVMLCVVLDAEVEERNAALVERVMICLRCPVLDPGRA